MLFLLTDPNYAAPPTSTTHTPPPISTDISLPLCAYMVVDITALPCTYFVVIVTYVATEYRLQDVQKGKVERDVGCWRMYVRTCVHTMYTGSVLRICKSDLLDPPCYSRHDRKVART